MFPELVIKSGDGSVSASVSPTRGAIVTSLEIDSKPYLYLDKDTFQDPSRNVRGGIPLLFPMCGKIENATLLASGTRMSQHGFARAFPWRVLTHENALISMELDSNNETMEQFPWEFTLRQNCFVTARGLHVELLIHNRSDRPMPISPGWHPYFVCPTAKKTAVAGDVEGANAGSVHDESEINFGIVAPANGATGFSIPDLGNIRLLFSPEMRHVQIWSVPGKDFVCLEPFHGAPNTINTPQAMIVEPGQARGLWMRIEKG